MVYVSFLGRHCCRTGEQRGLLKEDRAASLWIEMQLPEGGLFYFQKSSHFIINGGVIVEALKEILTCALSKNGYRQAGMGIGGEIDAGTYYSKYG